MLVSNVEHKQTFSFFNVSIGDLIVEQFLCQACLLLYIDWVTIQDGLINVFVDIHLAVLVQQVSGVFDHYWEMIDEECVSHHIGY